MGQLKQRFVLLFLLLFHFGTALFAGDGFSLFLTTTLKNRYGANFMVDAGHFKAGELANLFDQFEGKDGKSVLPPTDKPVDVIVVVPKSASEEKRQAFKDRIAREMKARYPKMKIRIAESFVDLKEDQDALVRQYRELEALDEKIPDTSPDQEYVDRGKEIIGEGIRDNQNTQLSWFGKIKWTVRHPWLATKYGMSRTNAFVRGTHPYNTIIAARAVAIGKFTSSALVLIGKYGLSPVSAALGVLNGAVSALFGYHAVGYSNFCTKHRFPFLRDKFLSDENPGPVKAATMKLVNLYNKTGWFKSATINFIRSLGISYIMRYLAYATEQTILNEQTGQRELVETPNTVNFLVGGLGLTIPEIVLDGLMDDGSRALELKGVWNRQARSYALWTVSLIDTFMHSLFRAGAVNAAYSVAFVSWGVKAGIYGAGKIAPAPTPRFVFISDDIAKTTEETLHGGKNSLFKEPGKTVPAKATKSALSFLYWFATLPTSMMEALYKRWTGKFTEPDASMVKWDLGLDETWSFDLTDEQKEIIRTDEKLTLEKFIEWLNLGDTDRKLVNALWEVRNAHLGESVSLPMMCTEALAKTG